MAGQDSAQGSGFVLQNAIQFCYHYHHDPQRIQLNNCNLSAEKVDPDRNYAHGVVYSAWPLQGTAEFEVELTSVRNELSRNLKIGVMRCRGHLKDQHIPRYSSPELNYCMWCANNLHDSMVAMVKKPYGSVNLDNLKKGDRVGLRLNRNGTLQFLVNGVVQGTAAQNVYMKGWNVYVVIDHYGDCTGTKITRAGAYYYIYYM